MNCDNMKGPICCDPFNKQQWNLINMNCDDFNGLILLNCNLLNEIGLT